LINLNILFIIRRQNRLVNLTVELCRQYSWYAWHLGFHLHERQTEICFLGEFFVSRAGNEFALISLHFSLTHM
jgi:hypothetical protein